MTTWLVNSALESVEKSYELRRQQSRNWPVDTLLDASWYRVDSRLVTIDGLGKLLMFDQVSAFRSLVGR